MEGLADIPGQLGPARRAVRGGRQQHGLPVAFLARAAGIFAFAARKMSLHAGPDSAQSLERFGSALCWGQAELPSVSWQRQPYKLPAVPCSGGGHFRGVFFSTAMPATFLRSEGWRAFLFAAAMKAPKLQQVRVFSTIVLRASALCPFLTEPVAFLRSTRRVAGSLSSRSMPGKRGRSNMRCSRLAEFAADNTVNGWREALVGP